MEPSKRYLELVEELNYHSKLYYTKDAPVISDYDYDMMMVELKKMEEEHPDWIRPDSPTQRVGDALYNTFEKVEHVVQMGSLQDVFSTDELFAFDERCRAVIPNPRTSVPENVPSYTSPTPHAGLFDFRTASVQPASTARLTQRRDPF